MLRLSHSVAWTTLRHVWNSGIEVSSTKHRNELLSSSLMLSCSRLMPASFTRWQITLRTLSVTRRPLRSVAYARCHSNHVAFQKVVEGSSVQVAWQCIVVSLYSKTLRLVTRYSVWVKTGADARNALHRSTVYCTRSGSHGGKASAMLNAAKT